jgi:CheY-like chemotaxis protein
MLAVSDTGTGMSREVQDKVFEPFFTTKEVGKGTGLGLSMVFGIVSQSRGYIWVRSEPGAGATFDVYLPRTDREPDAVPIHSDATTLHGSETILLVEDDEQVRLMARAILRRHGYDVIDAQNGGEAFLVCEKHPARIDLLLTDVVMPRMNGRELAERLAAIKLDMRVLYMSGYTDDEIIHHGVLEADIAFLHKPITPDRLLRKVREVLDARPAERSPRS